MKSKLLLPLLLSLLITGCGGDSWLGKSDNKKKLKGERLSVLAYDADLKITDLSKTDPITLEPAQYTNHWSQSGLTSDHAPGHLQIKGPLKKSWQQSIGRGSNTANKLHVTPVIANGRVYTMDCKSNLMAFDEQTGKKLWATPLKPKAEKTHMHGGGMAIGSDDQLYVTTAYGEILSIDPMIGKETWRVDSGSPIRSAPVFSQERVIVQTADNRVITLSPKDGKIIWKSTGIAENTSLLAASSPAAKDNIIVAPFSSGELNVINADTGRLFWTENLANNRRVGANTGLSDIKAPPIITDDLIISISHSGKLFGIDKRSGIRKWEQNIGGINMPWATKNTLYLISNNAELIALQIDTGKILFITELQKYRSEKKKDLIVWKGPVLASERLWLTNSLGDLIEISPYTGEKIGDMKLGKSISAAPIIANNAMFIQMENGTLIRLAAPPPQTAKKR
jgi:outer membrane protein assembly factor BamB